MSAMRTVVFLAVLLVTSCAPQTRSVPSLGAEGNQTEQPQERPTFRIAIQREPSIFNNVVTTATESSGGLKLLKQIPHNQLVVLDDRGVWVPQLAAEQLAVERGTWRLNPDGTMDTIWRLRPNVRWHDGAPFSSDDLLFTFAVY